MVCLYETSKGRQLSPKSIIIVKNSPELEGLQLLQHVCVNVVEVVYVAKKLKH